MRRTRIIPAVMAAFLMAVMLPVRVLAVVQTNYTPYTGQAADTVSFKKYLVMDKDATVPKVTFKFEVIAGPETPYNITSTPKKMQIRKNTSTTLPTVTDAVFVPGLTTYDTVQNGDVSVSLGTDEKYAKSQEDVVFSVKDVTFNEPGIYRYTVREKAVGAAVKGVTISDKLLYIDVYITDDGSGNLRLAQTSEITSDTQKPFIISSAPNNDTAGYDVTPNADSGSEAYSTEAKADGLVNKYTSFDLYFAKQVTGNQGSRDKYFMFDVTVNNLTDGYVVNADLTNAVASPTQTPATSYKTMTNPTSITANSSGTASGSFYLQDGQYIRLKGLPEGATYTVTEHPEDYTSLAADDSSLAASPIKTITVNEEEKKFVDPTANNTDTGITGDVFTGYRNTKNGTVPTGIVLAYTPVVIIGVLALAGIIFLAYKRKSE